MSGCDKSLSHGSTVNSVTKDTGSEATPSLTSNAPTPTSEPSKFALPAFDGADTGSSVKKYAVILSVIGVCYVCYKLLYRFASFKSTPREKLRVVEKIPTGYRTSYSYVGHYFDWSTNKLIEEIPVTVEGVDFYSYYQPNPSKREPLKTFLRKIFRIKTPQGCIF
jgi:hypothetical protein